MTTARNGAKQAQNQTRIGINTTMKATGNGAAAVSRKAERIAQNGINGGNRGTTKPIISTKSGIIPSSSASEINRAA